MGKNEDITTRFKVDISDLKRGITEANNQMKLANSEFKAVSNGTKEWEKSATGISAKLKQLDSILSAQTDKLRIYEKELEKAKEYQKKAGDNVDRLKKALEQAKSEFGENSEEVKKLERELALAERDEQKMADEVNRLNVAMNNQQGAINRTNAQIEQLGKTSFITSEKLGALAKSIAGGLAKAMAVGITAVGAGVAKLTKESLKSFSQFQQLQGGIKTLYGTDDMGIGEYAKKVGKSVKDVTGEYNKLKQAEDMIAKNSQKAFQTAGISANKYMEQATSFGASLISSLGGDTKKAAEYTDRAIRDMSDNANKMGTDIGSIQNAYQGFAKGNMGMLDNLKLGYGGTKSEMQRLIKDSSKMTDVQKELGVTVDGSSMSFDNIVNAISVMQSKLRITGTTSKEASTTIEGSLNMVKASWENLLTSFATSDLDMGEAMNNFTSSLETLFKNVEPVVKTILNGIIQMLPTFVNTMANFLTTNLPSVSNAIIEAFNKIVQMLPSVFQSIANMLPQLIQQFTNSVPIFIQAILTIFSSVITTIGQQMPQIMKSISDMIPKIVQAINNSLPLIINGVIALVQGLIQSLPAIIPSLIQGALMLVQGVINAIPQILPPLLQAIPVIIKSIIQMAQNNIGMIVQGIVSIVQSIVTMIPQILPPIIQAIPVIIQALITAMVSNMPILIQGIVTIITTLAQSIPQILPPLIEAIPQIVMAIVTALIENMPILIQGFVQLFGALAQALPQIIVAIGTSIGQLNTKILQLLLKGVSQLGQWVASLGSKAKEGFSKFLNTAITFLGQLPSKMAYWLSFAISKVIQFFANMVTKARTEVPKFVNNVINFIKTLPSKMWTWLTNAISKVAQFVSNLVKKGVEAGKQFGSAIIDNLKNLPSKMLSVGNDIIRGLWNGIAGAKDWLVGKVKTIASDILDGMKSSLGIKSPSRVMAKQVGLPIAQGVAVGITSGTKYVKKAVNKLAKSTVSEAKSSFSKSGFEDVAKNITKKFNTTLDKSIKNSNTSIKNLIKSKTTAFTKNLSKEQQGTFKTLTSNIQKNYSNVLATFQKEAKTLVSNTLTNLSKKFEEKFKKITDAYNNMLKKLNDFGEVFTKVGDNTLILNNLDEQTEAIEKYANTLKNLKSKVSTDLFDYITSLDVDTGKAFAQTLLDMTESERKAYDKSYVNKLKTAQKLTESLYSSDVKKLNKEYNNAVDKALKDVSTKVNDLGKQAISGFISGMKSQTKNLGSEVKKISDIIIKQFKKTLKIKSPSRRLADEVGRFLPLGIAQGIKDNTRQLLQEVKEMSDSVIETAKGIEVDNIIPDLSKAVNGLNMNDFEGANGFGGNTYNYTFNQTNNSPKALDRLEIYRQTQNQLNFAKMVVNNA